MNDTFNYCVYSKEEAADSVVQVTVQITGHDHGSNLHKHGKTNLQNKTETIKCIGKILTSI